MEATYSDNENGGAFKKNVIPELTELAQANEDFSGKSKKLNGGYAMPGATWTIGSNVCADFWITFKYFY